MKVVRFADWCDEARYHGYKPPRRIVGWYDSEFVYLLAGGPFVKIGVARDVQQRMANLRPGCPYELRAVSVRTVPAPLAYQIERKVHHHLADFRAYGEWFQLDVAHAKAIIHREIRYANAAIQKWTAAGYLQWDPSRKFA